MRLFLIILILVPVVAIAQTDKNLVAIDRLNASGEYTKATQLINEAQASADPNTTALLNNKRIEVLIGTGSLPEADKIAQQLSNWRWEKPEQRASYLTNSGALLLKTKAEQDLALEDLQEAYALFVLNPGTIRRARQPGAFRGLHSPTSLPESTVRPNPNGTISIQIRQQIFGDESEEVVASYNDLGLVYSQTDPDKALEY